MSTKNTTNIKAKDNFEYTFLSFDENVFLKFKALNNFQRVFISYWRHSRTKENIENFRWRFLLWKTIIKPNNIFFL